MGKQINQPATQVFGIELQPRLWASPSKLSSPMGSCLPCVLHFPANPLIQGAYTECRRCLVFLEQDCRRLDTCRMVEREEDTRWINGTDKVDLPSYIDS